MEGIQTRIRNLVRTNRLSQAIDLLGDYCRQVNAPDGDDSAVLLGRRFRDIEYNIHNGTLSVGKARRERNRIAKAILFQLRELAAIPPGNDSADKSVLLKKSTNYGIFKVPLPMQQAMTIDKLKNEGLKLDKPSRKELAYFLLDSIFEEALGDSLTPQQQVELESRLEAFEKGDMELIPGEEFANTLKARHGL